MPVSTVPAWMRGTPLEQIYITAWTETGDPNLALEAVRQSAEYDLVFPGNRRDDGTLRYDESTYLGIIESYADSLLSINVNPDLFGQFFPSLIEGLVSASEFAARIDTIYEQILDTIPQIREFYADNFALNMTTEAIVASVLHPDIGNAIINKQIAIAQVGGSAASKNFTVGLDLIEQMVNFGLDTTSEALAFFGEAESFVPTLSVLAARHADPDDDFDLAEFTSATLFSDPDQRLRMRRLLAQERASFTTSPSLTVQASQAGGLIGLEAR